MSHLMEKIKLSAFAKKAGKTNETTTGNILYDT